MKSVRTAVVWLPRELACIGRYVMASKELKQYRAGVIRYYNERRLYRLAQILRPLFNCSHL